jgi:hypothetical protein
VALLLKTHHAFLQPREPFAWVSIRILRVLGNSPLAQGDTTRQPNREWRLYIAASLILQITGVLAHNVERMRFDRCNAKQFAETNVRLGS